MKTSLLPRESPRSLLFCSNTKSNSECARQRSAWGHRNEPRHKRLCCWYRPPCLCQQPPLPRAALSLDIHAGKAVLPSKLVLSTDREEHHNRFNSSSSGCRSKRLGASSYEESRPSVSQSRSPDHACLRSKATSI